MKKQILLLLCGFMLTISFANGQNLTSAPESCPTARTIECLTGDALNPVPGLPYTYSVTVPNIEDGSGSYFWMVTQDKDFIVDGVLTENFETPGSLASHVLSVDPSANYGTAVTAAGKDEIEIIWKSFVHDPDNPVFVVIEVTGTDANDCPVNNLKVYMIQPEHAFTLDIAALHVDGTILDYDTPAESCFPEIVDARYDATSGGVLYDYGTSYVYFIITAANFNEAWKAYFQVEGVTAPQVLTDIAWQYQAKYANDTWTSVADITSPVIDLVEAQDESGAVGATGECIIVRLTLEHNNFEGIAAQTITLRVDGETELALATPLKDLHHDDADAECGKDDGFMYDFAQHIIQPRPDVQTNTQPGPTTKSPFLLNTGDANP
ncbi:hypothetical protein BA6E_11052 [Bacteroidales bacterium 6E]|nr:hypothetical protein BA6E_11052 [Bacteroidales bacterium 6E]